MKLWQPVYHGERIPSWYRVAYVDHCLRHGVAFIIGLHLVARLGRRLWEWSLRYRPSAFEIEMRVACSAAQARVECPTMLLGHSLHYWVELQCIAEELGLDAVAEERLKAEAATRKAS